MSSINNYLNSAGVNWNVYNPANEVSLSEAEANFLALVQLNPLKLRTAPENLKNHPTIMLAAVKRNGKALRFASEAIQNNETIVLAAVQQNGEALCFASDGMQDNEMIVLAAVQQDGDALEFASDRLQNDVDFQAIAQNPAGSNLLPIHFIQFDHFTSDPLNVLVTLQKKIIACRTFPKIRYFNSLGQDAGGLPTAEINLRNS